MLNRDSEYKIGSVVRDSEGRFIGIDLHIDDHILSVCTLYAPTQDKPKRQVEFLEELEDLLSQLQGSNMILGGDFNCILDVNKDKNTPGMGHPPAEQGRTALKSLIEEWGLVDIWRVRHPQERGYTLRRGQYSSRLDFFLVSHQLADFTDFANMELVPSSDHAMVNLQLSFSSEPVRGPGYWKFQPELLLNTLFVSEMTEFLESWEPPPETTSPTTLWEWLKHEIRSFVRHFTKTQKGAEKELIATLERDLSDLTGRRDAGVPDLTMQIDSVVRQIKEIEESRARGRIFRSRANWSLYGEKPTKYFLGLQKRRAKENTLSNLISSDGRQLTEHKEIMQEGRRFYEDLYQTREDEERG